MGVSSRQTYGLGDAGHVNHLQVLELQNRAFDKAVETSFFENGLWPQRDSGVIALLPPFPLTSPALCTVSPV